MELSNLTLRKLQSITNNFSYENLIGQGETGKVYKGLLESGQIVAVKLLHIGSPGLKDEGFKKQFHNISRLRHRNLLGHIGYIYETRYIRKSHDVNEKTFRVLCFDYMPNGSLDRYLDDASSGLDWQQRFQIIKGICEGLKYLHEGLQEPIYHLSLKPSNILLDHNMVPKLADFGLIKMIHEFLNERRRDKLACYWPPECIHGRVASTAFDVFSLGAVMIEIVTGLCDTKSTVMSPQKLIARAENNWRKRLQETFTGSELEDYCHQVKRCTEIALRCMEKDPHMRPNLVEVVKMLNPTDDMRIDPRKKVLQNPRDLFAQYIGNISSDDDGYKDLTVLESMLHGSGKSKPVQFQFLKLITKAFSDELRIGSGGCGEVYMGILRNGLIAVKRIFNSHTIEDKMFHQEVITMTMVDKHPNIVRFLGYCSHTGECVIEMPLQKDKKLSESIIMGQIRERLLCFEYISNGSLEDHLTDELRGLEWHERYQIIKGICKGLHHLHEDKHIIHMDLKPANILLDEHMVPKITDFGLSRIDEKSKTMSSERLLSLCYCPQEYMHDGKFSPKSDIYSLGVIIIELVAGSKELVTGSMENRNTAKVLRRWMHRWNKSAKDYSFVSLWYKQVTKCLDIALRCIDTEPLKRPHIREILSELNKVNSLDHFNSGAIGSSNPMGDLKEMLGVEPLEIHLSFELNKQITCSFHLDNDTDDYFAFSISTHSLRTYNIHPSIGIVQPRSKCTVSIALQPQKKAPLEEHCKEDFILLSTRVDGGLKDNGITGDMFDEEPGRLVDRVNLMVVLDVPNRLLMHV